MEDDEMAKALCDDMSVIELRKWMKQHDISRSRGVTKFQSALQAVEQKPDVVESYLGLNEPDASVHCQCGFEEWFDDTDDAVEAAKQHSVKKMSCNAKAWRADGVRIYG